MDLEEIVPPGLPFGACPYLRQRRRRIHFDQPDTPPKWELGEQFCSNPANARHSALDAEGVEKCIRRGDGACWMPEWPPEHRPLPR